MVPFYRLHGERIPPLQDKRSSEEFEGLINIWTIDIKGQLPFLANYEQLLTPAERSHAARFHQPKDAQQYIITRAILRILLAEILSLQPREIEITTNENKKPVILDLNEIHFNVSHSDNQAVIAIAKQRIGIDVEFVKPRFDYLSVAEYAFSDEESDHLKRSTNPHQDFFRLWTRKEAYLKGMGTGLVNELKTISCTGTGIEVPVTVNGLISKWAVKSFALNSEYIMSIAYERSAYENQIFLFDFSQAAL